MATTVPSITHPTLNPIPCNLPIFDVAVSAGFPSPAEDHTASRIDLTSYLVKHPSATFIVRAKGESMRDAGIFDGALLIVDNSLTPQNGDIVIAEVEGSFTVKRLRIMKGGAWLVPENTDFEPQRVDHTDVRITGVVASCINQFRNMGG